MNHPSSALVLGGGGSAGNAWSIGVLAGLGLDFSEADLTIGTSAGSTVAAQLAGTAAAELFADVINAPVPPPARGRPLGDHLERLARMVDASADVADYRRRAGAAALELPGSSDAATQAQWRATVASRLSGTHWPSWALGLTAVDAHTGEPVVFTRDSGVELVDAVAASCAGSFAYGIGAAHYIDGGYRTNADNADLAAGYARVLVLSPLGGRSLHPAAWGTHLDTQVRELRATGSVVETVLPDTASLAAFGDNMMDYSTRPASAQAGFDQGRALADGLSALWRE